MMILRKEAIPTRRWSLSARWMLIWISSRRSRSKKILRTCQVKRPPSNLWMWSSSLKVSWQSHHWTQAPLSSIKWVSDTRCQLLSLLRRSATIRISIRYVTCSDLLELRAASIKAGIQCTVPNVWIKNRATRWCSTDQSINAPSQTAALKSGSALPLFMIKLREGAVLLLGKNCAKRTNSSSQGMTMPR